MADFSAFSHRTLKVAYDGETRRGRLSITTNASPVEAFSAIEEAIASLFDVPSCSMKGFRVKYLDEDGDLCTLTEQTMTDFASVANEGVVRLTLIKAIGSGCDGRADVENVPSPMEVEVTHDGETRRGRLSVMTDASPAEAFSAVQGSLASLFDIPPCSIIGFQIKYLDEEGDLCTLTEHTVTDFLLLASEGMIHLAITQTLAPRSGESKELTECSCPMEADTDATPKDGPCADADCDFRAKLQCLAQKVPPGLRPFILSFVQDMDPASIHEVIGIALAHNDPAMIDHEVVEALLHLHSMEPDALQALILDVLKSDADTSKGMGRDSTSCTPQQSLLRALLGAKGCGKGDHKAGEAPTFNLFGDLLGPLLAGKGFGKGGGAASTLDASPTPNPFGDFLGPLLAGKGFGNGGGAASTLDGSPTPNPFGDFLGPLLAGKGLGKGAGAATGLDGSHQPNPFGDLLGSLLAGKKFSKGGDAASGLDGLSNDPGSGQGTRTDALPLSPGNTVPTDAAAARVSFEESVTDLLNMGLVTDRQVARKLLTQHGDISTVVAILAESQE